jgi:hypothetical protein
MTAMQQFKVRTGKAFPTYAEVLTVARSLGYSRAVASPPLDGFDDSGVSFVPSAANPQ